MQSMGLIDADDTGNATNAAATADIYDDSNGSDDEVEDEDDGLEDDNHMDIDAMENDAFGHGLDYGYGDREMGYRSESDRSETPSSTGKEQASEDEDGFAHITEADYREFERWYTEDDMLELDEMIAETLTVEEISSMKMAAIRLFGHISQRNYERIRYSFKQHLQLMSIYRVHKKLAKLSGISPTIIDCCTNVCHAFTGKYANEEVCSSCGYPRFDSKRKPYKTFEYLPTTPRFQGYFNNPAMVQAMNYRHEYKLEPGRIDEYFDSTNYADLRATDIVVEGVNLGVKYFRHQRDIAYMVMLDGVQLFDQPTNQKSTCWPIMAQNLNLPASQRAKLRNLIPLGVIPGPYQPKDFDSFLLPFVEEALEQARGVETYDVTTGKKFTLRAHPVIISGDMQAIKHVTQMKGPNAKLPCRGCEISRIYHTCRRTYYIPLTNPINKPDAIPDNRWDPNAGPDEYTGFDPLNLPLRTTHRINKQLDKIDAAPTKTKREELETKFGLNGDSILSHIPSIKCPDSYPHEFLHLFLLNHGKELFLLWSGKHERLEGLEGPLDFVLSINNLIAIGNETEDSTRWFPARFTRAIPSKSSILKYYDHYMELVDILNCLLSVTNTRARIEQLKLDVAHYVEGFEELYYQYKYERMFLCKLTLHAILHVPDDVIRCGPVWVYWSFPLERYCREVTFCAKSKVLPYTAISKHVLQLSQIGAVSCRFPEIRKALLFGKNDVPVGENVVSKMEQVYPGYESHILRFPRLREFALDKHVRQRLAAYSRTNEPGYSYAAWYKFLPKRCERWGKLRIADGGDCIRAAKACNPTSVYGKRDSSFIRFSYQKDKNEDDPRASIEMVPAIGYGRLDFILAFTLARKTPPPNQQGDELDAGEDEDEPSTHVLAQITEAKGVEGDATTELITYREFGRSFILDIKNVEHAVARVYTQGVRPNGEWAIIDRSQGVAHVEFGVDEHSSEEEDQ
ncbi:hypothetical protein RSAG8_11226, partial [Rhizoctonia solani AG-8 WAC10335]